MDNDEIQPTFIVFFNKNKQWLDIYLWDVHPTTFQNWGGGRWGYTEEKWNNSKSGLFAEVHFVKSRIREDLVVHELDHVRTAWMWANGFTITRSNEERMTVFLDQLVGKFYREYRKV